MWSEIDLCCYVLPFRHTHTHTDTARFVLWFVPHVACLRGMNNYPSGLLNAFGEYVHCSKELIFSNLMSCEYVACFFRFFSLLLPNVLVPCWARMLCVREVPCSELGCESGSTASFVIHFFVHSKHAGCHNDYFEVGFHLPHSTNRHSHLSYHWQLNKRRHTKQELLRFFLSSIGFL
jgi:hypothetical protein